MSKNNKLTTTSEGYTLDLQSASNHFNGLIDCLPHKVFVKDINSVYLACNAAFARDLGIKPQEISGKTDHDFYPNKLVKKFHSVDQRVMLSGKAEDFDETYSVNGQEYIVSTTKSPLTDIEGKVIGVIGIYHDITEKKQILEDLSRTNQRFRSLLNFTSEAILCYEFDPPIPTDLPIQEQIPLFYRGVLVESNDIAAKTLRADKSSEVIGKSLLDIYGLETGELNNFYEMFIESGYCIIGLEAEENALNGTQRSYLNNVHGVVVDGLLRRVWSTYQDITERTQTNKLIRIQRDLGIALMRVRGIKETLNLCLESAIQVSEMDSGGIYLFDDDGGMVLVATSGLPESFVKSGSYYAPDSANVDMVKKGIPIYSRHQDLGIKVDGARELEGLKGIGIIPIYSDGEVIACLNVASHKSDDVPEFSRISLESITTQLGNAIARSRAEFELNAHRENLEELVVNRTKELSESETRYRAIYEHSPLGIVAAGKMSQIIEVNSAFCKMLGHSEEELLGKKIQDFIYHEDLAESEEFMRQTISNATSSFSNEIRLLNKAKKVVWCNLSSTMLFDEDGAPLMGLSVVEDITERIHSQQALEKSAQKLAISNQELEQFAYIASHDLQKPLRKISAFGTRLQTSFRDALGEQGQVYIDRMQVASEQGQRLINDLLEFSRVNSEGTAFEYVDLNLVLKEVLSNLEINIVDVSGEIEVEDLPLINADSTQMGQLFTHLIGNSLKFHQVGTPPKIKVSVNKNQPGIVELHIVDNGIGFEMQYLDRIFQPFQRLHGQSEYEGSGIGLSICRKIVERHGGILTARSKPNEGATFIISFPEEKTMDKTLEDEDSSIGLDDED